MGQRDIFLIGGEEDEQARLVDEEVGGRCRIVCTLRGATTSVEADDFFGALQALRVEALEPLGLIPFCYGASLNVWPSGMARDMGRGLKAYRTHMGEPARDLVPIFGEGPDVIPATVERQTEYHRDWAQSLSR